MLDEAPSHNTLKREEMLSPSKNKDERGQHLKSWGGHLNEWLRFGLCPALESLDLIPGC